MRRTALAAAAVLAALPALAQDDDALSAEAQTAEGSITGTLALDDAIWQIAGDGESSWRETEDGIEVTITGIPSPEGADGSAGELEVTFALEGGATEREANDVVVSYDTPGGETVTAEDVNANLTLNALAIEGTDMAIAGDLVAAMSPGGTEGLALGDVEVVTFDGNFQGTIPQAD